MTEVRGIAVESHQEQIQPPLMFGSKPDGRLIPVLKLRIETSLDVFTQVIYKGDTQGSVKEGDKVTVRGNLRDGVLYAERIENHTTNSFVTGRRCARCFIATAAYGPGHDSEIAVLQEFRDRVLLTQFWGRCFVALYYRVSPALAAMIQDSRFLRDAVRTAFVQPLFRWVSRRFPPEGS